MSKVSTLPALLREEVYEFLNIQAQCLFYLSRLSGLGPDISEVIIEYQACMENHRRWFELVSKLVLKTDWHTSSRRQLALECMALDALCPEIRDAATTLVFRRLLQDTIARCDGLRTLAFELGQTKEVLSVERKFYQRLYSGLSKISGENRKTCQSLDRISELALV